MWTRSNKNKKKTEKRTETGGPDNPVWADGPDYRMPSARKLDEKSEKT